MKPLFHSIAFAGLLLLSCTLRADEEYDFPKVGAEYRIIYSAFRTIKEGDHPQVSGERTVTLKILHVQPNGWILATTISYYYLAETSREKKPERIKKESPPSWYNLNAFTQATKVEEK